MGLQCSILGHSFEPAGVEREREEQGSEVVTTEREMERCRRCGSERVVSESTEVTAVVDGEAVGLETDVEADSETASDDASSGGGFAGVVDRSDLDEADEGDGDTASRTPASDIDENDPGVGNAARPTGADDRSPAPELADEPPDPEAEDAEILTDEAPDSERAPGQWPDETDSDDGVETDEATDEEPDVPLEEEATVESLDEESLSGITVPEGEIVCPECGFRIEARSGYRDGDSCPECSAWLEAERNQ